MLLNVVDQCLSLAFASARQTRSRSFASHQRWQAPLAAYPRLQAVMQKAEAEGLLRRTGRMH
jgi:hypothetical protein